MPRAAPEISATLLSSRFIRAFIAVSLWVAGYQGSSSPRRDQHKPTPTTIFSGKCELRHTRSQPPKREISAWIDDAPMRFLRGRHGTDPRSNDRPADWHRNVLGDT